MSQTLGEYAELLPKDTELTGIKLKIPAEDIAQARLAGMATDYAYLYSFWNRGVWIKESLSSQRMFPMIDATDILDWEIA